MISVTNAEGARVDLSGEMNADLFRKIEASGLTAHAYLNLLADTGVDQPTVFEQVSAAYGFVTGRNEKFGIRPSTMESILNPVKIEAGAITRDADLGPRVFFPIFALSVMEKALRADQSPILGAYNRMVAVRDTIPGDTFERPIIDYSETEKPRGAFVAQLSEPRIMVKATMSSKIYRIPSEAIGVEYSDQAAKALGLDFLMTGFARRAEMAAIDRVYDHIYGFLNGNVDMDMASLAATTILNDDGVSEAVIRKANTFDATINVAGKLTQLAWIKFLYNNTKRRTINMVITDLAGALAIQNREGRPNVNTDNGTSKRIDTLENVVNPMWPDKVDIFIINDSRWPANLVLGLDTRYGVHHITSTALNYQGAEQWAIRRSTKLRFDLGETSHRMFNEAWSGLSLTL